MSCQHARPMGRFASYNVVGDLLGQTMVPLHIDGYVTVLDPGPWGAFYARLQPSGGVEGAGSQAHQGNHPPPVHLSAALNAIAAKFSARRSQSSRTHPASSIERHPEVETAWRRSCKDPRLIETYVRTYNEERKRLAATANATRTRIEKKRDRLEKERQRAIDMVIKGVIGEEDARTRIADLKTQVLQAEVELASLDEVPQNIALHPATLTRYIATVDRLAAVLADHAQAVDDRGPLVPDFRALVHSVTIHPKPAREGFQVEVKGKLAALIGGEAFPQAKYSGGRVVAEEGLEPPTRGL
jgi:hypothetical protein